MVVWRDPSLPHQIALIFRPGKPGGTQLVTVTCNCGTTLGARPRWDDPGEPMRLWQEHEASVSDPRPAAAPQ